jgi:hypothetical protein
MLALQQHFRRDRLPVAGQVGQIMPFLQGLGGEAALSMRKDPY